MRALLGNLGEGFVYKGLMYRRRLWRWVSLSIGTLLGNLGVGGGGSVY
jgi:hypothetical protein